MPKVSAITKRAAARQRKATSRSVTANGSKPRVAVKRVSSRELVFGDLWEFDPAPETADPKLKVRYDLFINGEFVAPKSGKYFETINPANE